MDIAGLIEIIPSIAMYFIPYAVFMWVYQLGAHKTHNIKILSIESVAYSFILTTITKQFGLWLFGIELYDFWIICWSGIIGLCSGLIVSNEYIDTYIIAKYFNRTLDDNIWYGIRDAKHGCFVEAFLTDGLSYKGIYFKNYSDSTGEWIVLSNYTLYKDGIADESNNKTDDDDFQVALDVKNISRIHVQYHPQSYKKVNG